MAAERGDEQLYVINRDNVLEVIERAAMLALGSYRQGGPRQWNPRHFTMPLLHRANAFVWLLEAADVDLDTCQGSKFIPVPRQCHTVSYGHELTHQGRPLWNAQDEAVHWSIVQACGERTPAAGLQAAIEYFHHVLDRERRTLANRENGARRKAVMAADLTAAEHMAAGALRVLTPLSALRVLASEGLATVNLRDMTATLDIDPNIIDQEDTV